MKFDSVHVALAAEVASSLYRVSAGQLSPNVLHYFSASLAPPAKTTTPRSDCQRPTTTTTTLSELNNLLRKCDEGQGRLATGGVGSKGSAGRGWLAVSVSALAAVRKLLHLGFVCAVQKSAEIYLT